MATFAKKKVNSRDALVDQISEWNSSNRSKLKEAVGAVITMARSSVIEENAFYDSLRTSANKLRTFEKISTENFAIANDCLRLYSELSTRSIRPVLCLENIKVAALPPTSTALITTIQRDTVLKKLDYIYQTTIYPFLETAREATLVLEKCTSPKDVKEALERMLSGEYGFRNTESALKNFAATFLGIYDDYYGMQQGAINKPSVFTQALKRMFLKEG